MELISCHWTQCLNKDSATRTVDDWPMKRIEVISKWWQKIQIDDSDNIMPEEDFLCYARLTESRSGWNLKAITFQERKKTLHSFSTLIHTHTKTHIRSPTWKQIYQRNYKWMSLIKTLMAVTGYYLSKTEDLQYGSLMIVIVGQCACLQDSLLVIEMSACLKAGILSTWDSGLFQGTTLWGILCMKWHSSMFRVGQKDYYYKCGGIIAYMKGGGYTEVWGREWCASKLSLRIQRDFRKRNLFYKAEEWFMALSNSFASH